MERVISNSELENLTSFNPRHHSESKMYVDGNVVYKILRCSHKKLREETLKSFINNPIEGLVNIYDLLYDENEHFIGYTLEYLKNYKTMYHVMLSKNYNIDSRKLSLILFNNVIQELINRGYYFYDIHDENIMIRGKKSKVVDVDGIRKNYLDDERLLQMKADTIILALNYLFSKRYRIDTFIIGSSELISKEFSNDIIIKSYFDSVESIKILVRLGYTFEEIMSSINEDKVNKMKYVMSRYK